MTEHELMGSILLMLAIWITGFAGGYVLRSYISFRRRTRTRRSRYDIPTTRRTLMPAQEKAQTAKLDSNEGSPLVPEDVA